MVSGGHRLLLFAGSAGNTPRPIAPDGTKKTKGLEWKYQWIEPMPSSACMSVLQSGVGGAVLVTLHPHRSPAL
jgi:hypothetical protein